LLTGKSRVAHTKKKYLQKISWSTVCKDKTLIGGLHWLKKHSVTLLAFVGNRISEIQEWSADGQWKFAPGGSNVADIV